MRLITIWRILVAVGDYRRLFRLLRGKPKLDVVFICNVRDEAERALFYKPGASRMAQENGPRMHINGVAGQIRGINFTAEEMYSREGRQHAKRAFIEAVEWAHLQGARVILLAASTKRLFGRTGAELKKRFPDMLFTIGDNGTAQLLCSDVDRALARPEVGRWPRILVIGPYGILGQAVCEHLRAQGHDFVGYGTTPSLLKSFAESTGSVVVGDLQTAGKFDLVVCCTHSDEAKLTEQSIDWLRVRNRKLIVVDVAEPANLERDVYARCADRVVRQDAGNAFSRKLHYVLGPLSYRKLMLSRGSVFGCFAESMSLFNAVYRKVDPAMQDRDWFSMDVENRELVAKAFSEMEIGLPEPHCFGLRVSDFNLVIPSNPLPALSSQPQTV